MDDAFCYIADFVDCNDSWLVNRHTSDSNFDSGADVNIYPENLGCLLLHSYLVALDKSENARYDPRDSWPTRKIHKLTMEDGEQWISPN